MIIRPDYINAIAPYIDTPLVKILAGVRRCGKSTILAMLREELKSRGISAENIIARKYNEMEIDDGFSAKDMYDELKVDPSHEEVIAQCQFYGEVTKRIRAMVEELYEEHLKKGLE